ncbi:MAG: M48 family metallopeptidase [Candidatus Sumerlaeia bacterium]|nr:M48 family metallopeptidase [Candidatus Sumerlaeia bacterium]
MMEMGVPASRARREVKFGSHTFRYELAPTSSESLSITVYPDLRIRVKAPATRPLEQVDDRVRRRGNWIIKQLEYFHQFLPLPAERRYLSGETHFYLGRQYRLKVVQAESQKCVTLKGQYLFVHVADKTDTNVIKGVLDQWYRLRARDIFGRHLERCLKKVSKHGITSPPLRIQRMKKRWGSYTSTGTMILNLDLIKTPVHCIEYVITHELCHSRHPHHGPEFENLLTRCLPDWRKRKSRLEQAVIT